jgi:hypothetical protein
MTLEEMQQIIQRIRNDDPSSISNIQYALGALIGYVSGLNPPTEATRVYGAVPDGLKNSVNRTFQLPMFITGTEVVFLNGVRLTRGVNADYTIVGNVNNTTQILLAVAPTPAAVLSADYQPVS